LRETQGPSAPVSLYEDGACGPILCAQVTVASPGKATANRNRLLSPFRLPGPFTICATIPFPPCRDSLRFASMTTLPVHSHLLSIGCYYTPSGRACQERMVVNFRSFLDLTKAENGSIVGRLRTDDLYRPQHFTVNLSNLGGYARPNPYVSWRWVLFCFRGDRCIFSIIQGRDGPLCPSAGGGHGGPTPII